MGYCGFVPNCLLCVPNVQPYSMVIQLPCASGHVYHAECVLDWLKRSQRCPVCGTNIVTDAVPPIVAQQNMLQAAEVVVVPAAATIVVPETAKVVVPEGAEVEATAGV